MASEAPERIEDGCYTCGLLGSPIEGDHEHTFDDLVRAEVLERDVWPRRSRALFQLVDHAKAVAKAANDARRPAEDPPNTDTTPDAVAAALAKVLPRRTSIFDVELVQSTRGCVARARIGTSPHAQREITGLGKTLAEAIVALHNEATPVALPLRAWRPLSEEPS